MHSNTKWALQKDATPEGLVDDREPDVISAFGSLAELVDIVLVDDGQMPNGDSIFKDRDERRSG